MSLAQRYASLSQLHEDPRLIAFAATPRGRALTWLVATLLLAPNSMVFSISPILALVLIAPQWRTQILCLGSIFVLDRQLTSNGLSGTGELAAMYAFIVGLLYLTYLAARSYRSLPHLVQRNSQIVLHALIGALMALSFLLPDSLTGEGRPAAAAIRSVRLLLPYFVWRMGYILLAGRRGSAAGSSFLDHLLYCLPVYGSTGVPYGKGYDHLKRCRADEPLALARSALAGIKLLVLVWLWVAARDALTLFVYGDPVYRLGSVLELDVFHLPRLGEVIANPGGVPYVLIWVSMFLELVDFTLSLAGPGHTVVGCLRLFGFNVFRNTYKPLLAQSIVDFWNRFYHYFKELLVEFFFFPTYVSVFKSYPRLRIFTAIMAAAFFGNLYFHALRDTQELVDLGLGATIAHIGPRSVYCFLLAVGIFFSMMREQQRRGAAAVPQEQSPLRAFRRIAGVWLFYAIIHIWNARPIELTITQRTRFFFSLFGL
jgi:hypothetical protein